MRHLFVRVHMSRANVISRWSFFVFPYASVRLSTTRILSFTKTVQFKNWKTSGAKCLRFQTLFPTQGCLFQSTRLPRWERHPNHSSEGTSLPIATTIRFAR